MTIEYLRQFRLAGYAIFDFAAAFAGVALLGPLFSWLARKAGLQVPRANWLYLTLPGATFVHVLSGHITPMTRDVMDPGGHYVLKGVMLALVYLGLRNIKRIRRPEGR